MDIVLKKGELWRPVDSGALCTQEGEGQRNTRSESAQHDCRHQSRRGTLTNFSILGAHHDEELSADAGFGPELVITSSLQLPKRILCQTIP